MTVTLGAGSVQWLMGKRPTRNPKHLCSHAGSLGDVLTDFNYRTDNLVNTITTTSSGQQLDRFVYDYDENKNVTQETRGDAMAAFSWTAQGATNVGYDNENRLTGWRRDNNSLDQDWTLSLVGDWDQFTENTVAQNRLYNEAHEIATIDGIALSHDAKGNRTGGVGSIPVAPTANARLTWDFDNRLRFVDTDGDGIDDVEYAYDALGRRVRQIVEAAPASDIVYVCLGKRVACEYNASAPHDDPLELYVYGSYIDEIILKRSSTPAIGDAYYTRNRRYSISLLTDSAGNAIERIGYDAYGKHTYLDDEANPTDDGTTIGNDYTYTGRRLDPATGLLYFRARYYDPQTGEFISRDPLGYVDGMSLYRGYFAPGAMDPTGGQIVAYINNGTEIVPVKKFLGKCHYYIEVNGKKIKTATPCPGTSPDDPEGPTYAHGRAKLEEIAAKLKEMCNTCASNENCTFTDEGCNKRKCRQEAAIIQKVLLLAWASNYGKGNGTHGDCVAGYFCWDWENIFTGSITNQEFSCFKAQRGGANGPIIVEEGEEVQLQHFYTRLYVGNKTEDCSVLIDDGFFDRGGNLVHDPPFPPADNLDYRDERDMDLIVPGQEPTGLLIPRQ